MRTSRSACEALPTASSKYSSCFSSSRSSNDQLSGRRNSSIFSMIVRRTWSSWREEVSAFPNSWKTATSPFSRSDDVATLRRRSTAGNCFTFSTRQRVLPLWFYNPSLFSPRAHDRARPAKASSGPENRTRPCARLKTANLPQYRPLLKKDAICLWYGSCDVAIFVRRVGPSVSSTRQLLHLTVPSRPAYSPSRASAVPAKRPLLSHEGTGRFYGQGKIRRTPEARAGTP